jgi:hypothetical protein
VPWWWVLNVRCTCRRRRLSWNKNLIPGFVSPCILNAVICFGWRVFPSFNPLTPELNPSPQRCLTRFFTGDFASWTAHFVNICVKNQQMQHLLIQFINYVWYLLHVSELHRHCHLRSPRTTSLHTTPIHNILSTAPQLSISQKALWTLPEDGNVMPKHVGDTKHN